MANMYTLSVPILLYVVTLGSSLAWLVVSSNPGAVYSTRAVQVTGLCYWTCSAAMNMCASSLISARFWMHRRAIMRAIGSKQGTFYLGYMAMTLESAALYTVFVIIALVVFVLNSPLENVFFPVLGTVQVRSCLCFWCSVVFTKPLTHVSCITVGVDRRSHPH